MINDPVPKTARNYKPQGKRDIVKPKKRESDQINGMQNRMNLRLICENIQTLQKIHPHDIIWICWCHTLVTNLEMIKLNSTHIWLNKTWLISKYLIVGVQMQYASNQYIPLHTIPPFFAHLARWTYWCITLWYQHIKLLSKRNILQWWTIMSAAQVTCAPILQNEVFNLYFWTHKWNMGNMVYSVT